MRRHPSVDDLPTLQPRPRQSDPPRRGDPARAGQEKSRADVREEPDRALWHREESFRSRDPVAAVDAEPGAAAHDDAVDQRHVRLPQARDQVVEPVLGPEEGEGDARAPRRDGRRGGLDVAARAEEGPLARRAIVLLRATIIPGRVVASEDDRRDGRVGVPSGVLAEEEDDLFVCTLERKEEKEREEVFEFFFFLALSSSTKEKESKQFSLLQLTMFSVSAFRALGRLSVAIPTAPRCSKRTCGFLFVEREREDEGGIECRERPRDRKVG